jgi:hypothetical protein
MRGNMNPNTHLKKALRELERLQYDADNLVVALGFFSADHHDALPYQQMVTAAQTLKEAMVVGRAAFAEESKEWIKEEVTDWHAERVYDEWEELELAEDAEIVPPQFESVSWCGDDTWKVVIVTPTHDREELTINSDGVRDFEVKNVEVR